MEQKMEGLICTAYANAVFSIGLARAQSIVPYGDPYGDT